MNYARRPEANWLRLQHPISASGHYKEQLPTKSKYWATNDNGTLENRTQISRII